MGNSTVWLGGAEQFVDHTTGTRINGIIVKKVRCGGTLIFRFVYYYLLQKQKAILCVNMGFSSKEKNSRVYNSGYQSLVINGA